MIVFIDEHKDRTSCGLRWSIEPICDQLPIAPATYYVARTRWRCSTGDGSTALKV